VVINQAMAGRLANNKAAYSYFIEDEIRHHAVLEAGGISTIIAFDERPADGQSLNYDENAAITNSDYFINREQILKTYTDPEIQNALLWLQIIDPEEVNYLLSQQIPVTVTSLNEFNSFAGIYCIMPWDNGHIGIAGSTRLKGDEFELAGILSHEIKHSMQLKGFSGKPFVFYAGMHYVPVFQESLEQEAYFREWSDLHVLEKVHTEVAEGRLPADPAFLSQEDVAVITRIRDDIQSRPLSVRDSYRREKYFEAIWAYGDYQTDRAIAGSAIFASDILIGAGTYVITSRMKRYLSGLAEQLKARGKDGGINDGKVGGIDLRELAAASSSPSPQAWQELQKLAEASSIQDMDKAWQEIEVRMVADKMPFDCIKEYIAVCSARPDGRKHLDKVACCILNILRVEEEQAVSTSAQMKDILALIG